MPRKNTRSSGVLLPLFAIPGGPDLGTLGKSALRFLDFLKNAKQTVFQTLPINPTDEAGSPYAGRSAFAGEPLYLDLEELRDEGLIADVLEEERASSSPKTVRTWARDVVDYPRAAARRKPLWNEAFQNYRDKRGGKKFRDQEERFRAENAFWLDDFALFPDVDREVAEELDAPFSTLIFKVSPLRIEDELQKDRAFVGVGVLLLESF